MSIHASLMISTHRQAFITVGSLLITLSSRAHAAAPVPPLFETSVGQEDLDANAFAEWVDGVERKIDESRCKQGPLDVLWTRETRPQWQGVAYGRDKAAGIRHLRVGFRNPVSAGTVVVRGGGTLSVLKPDAAYPGDLGDDAQWIPAERLVNGQDGPQVVSAQEVDPDEYAFWVLPPSTLARALRFTHVASPSQRDPAGVLGNAWVLSDRVTNIGPQGNAVSRSHSETVDRVLNGTNDTMWQAWANTEPDASHGEIIDSANWEWIIVTWRQPIQLSGVAFLWAGFSACDVQVLRDGVEHSPVDAPESSWVDVASAAQMEEHYPMPLCPTWLAMETKAGDPIKTTAMRLRMKAPATSNHDHLRAQIAGGRRVWLGELAALTKLNDAPLSSVVLPAKERAHAPIPVQFTISKPGLVTLVIDDEEGKRVRNLISETPFEAGDHVVWWDVSNDLGRDLDSPRHGLYSIPTQLVAPGRYQVRGLSRDPLKLVYEMSVYSSGRPAWETEDGTGCWMTNHTPPTSVAFVPGDRTTDGEPLVFMGAYVSEGGHGLQWVREDGTKVGGQGRVGGHWTGAPTLATDQADGRLDDDLCYVASVWEGELRITAKTKSLGDREIIKRIIGDDPHIDQVPDDQRPEVLVGFDGGEHRFVLAGLAVHNRQMVLSFPRQNELRLIPVDAAHREERLPIDRPRGVAFDKQGQLFAISGNRVLRRERQRGDTPAQWIDIGIESLQDPRQIAIDDAGRLYISDRGDSHQVKIFSANGAFIRAIGKPGTPTVGLYDPLHINTPNGVAIDRRGCVWVAECDFRPKRISVWNPNFGSDQDAELIDAFYGPGEYGGGGVLDPVDKSRFFYKGMEFDLDWEHGRSRLVRVFDRPPNWLQSHYGAWSPDTPLYPNRASHKADSADAPRYFTSCYTTNPTSGDSVAFVWLDGPEYARPVAGIGAARQWRLLQTAAYQGCWPAGIEPQNDRSEHEAFFTWSDLSGDGQPQPDEVSIRPGVSGGVTIDDTLTAVVARLDGNAVRFRAIIDVATHVPRYSIDDPELLLGDVQGPASSGGDQALASGESIIFTNAPRPFSNHGLGGATDGKPIWSYPSLWPGLHASHEAAVPDRPGMIVGHTRLLGGLVRPSEATGAMFCVNGNMGDMYLMTTDGLFVATLFHDIRLKPKWSMPLAVRGMDVSDVSLHDENFWPSITQTAEGNVYLVDGANTSIVRVDGLDSIRRLPPQTIEVTAADLGRASEWTAAAEAVRQADSVLSPLQVSLRSEAPHVDGDLSDWPTDEGWAIIDRRGIAANFNSNSRPYDVAASVCVADGKLFAAYRSSEKDLLSNRGGASETLFKTGGCLDLMLATEPFHSDSKTRDAGAGDIRLLVTQVDGKTRAMLYRAVVPGTEEPVKFSSPWRTIELDQVVDVSDQLDFATNNDGHFEFSIPLSVLGWKPRSDEVYRGDLGVLRGDGRETTQRVYWSNKATAITSDVPSEAQLSPSLWGTWQVR